jgi:hypothetical protein
MNDKQPKPIKFDPDLSPNAQVNQDAAEARGLHYSERDRVYKDSDGCQILDRFGQPLG